MSATSINEAIGSVSVGTGYSCAASSLVALCLDWEELRWQLVLGLIQGLLPHRVRVRGHQHANPFNPNRHQYALLDSPPRVQDRSYSMYMFMMIYIYIYYMNVYIIYIDIFIYIYILFFWGAKVVEYFKHIKCLCSSCNRVSSGFSQYLVQRSLQLPSFICFLSLVIMIN